MITEHLQRFILTSIDSIPHLEAILLLRVNPYSEWSPKAVAEKLFINEKKAMDILNDLCASHVAVKKEACCYQYKPVSVELKLTLDQLADLYARNLIEVTNLVHSKTDKKAQQFGDAFKWPPGKDQ